MHKNELMTILIIINTYIFIVELCNCLGINICLGSKNPGTAPSRGIRAVAHSQTLGHCVLEAVKDWMKPVAECTDMLLGESER